MEEKKIKKKLTISTSSKKTHNVQNYVKGRGKTSVVIEKKSLRPISFNTYTYDQFHAIIFFYICRNWNGSPLSKKNHQIIWTEIDKLKRYKFLPGSNKFILELNDLFKK